MFLNIFWKVYFSFKQSSKRSFHSFISICNSCCHYKKCVSCLTSCSPYVCSQWYKLVNDSFKCPIYIFVWERACKFVSEYNLCVFKISKKNLSMNFTKTILWRKYFKLFFFLLCSLQFHVISKTDKVHLFCS